MPNTLVVCPKCSTPMSPGTILCIVPALNKAEERQKISNDSGMPVQTYRCPKCEYVELYHRQET
jgi:predicted nucleic-acid-binding Zn-ribbon protein